MSKEPEQVWVCLECSHFSYENHYPKPHFAHNTVANFPIKCSTEMIPYVPLSKYNALKALVDEVGQIMKDLNKDVPDFMKGRTRSSMWLERYEALDKGSK